VPRWSTMSSLLSEDENVSQNYLTMGLTILGEMSIMKKELVEDIRRRAIDGRFGRDGCPRQTPRPEGEATDESKTRHYRTVE